MRSTLDVIYLSIIDAAIIALLVYLYLTSSITAVGGGLGLFVLGSIFVTLYNRYFRKLIGPLSRLAILLYALCLYNYIANNELIHGYSIGIVASNVILTIIMWSGLLGVMLKPLTIGENSNKIGEDERNLRKYVFGRFTSGCIYSIVGTGGVVCFTNSSFIDGTYPFRVSMLTPIFFLIGVAYTYVCVNRIPKQYLKHLLRVDVVDDLIRIMENPAKWFFYPTLIFLLLGIGIENIRGDWATYILSIAMLLGALYLMRLVWGRLDGFAYRGEFDYADVPDANDLRIILKDVVFWFVLLMAIIVTMFAISIFIKISP